MRRLKWGYILGILAFPLVAFAAQVPLQTGVNCGSASQLQSCVNSTILSVNANTGGVISSIGATYTTSGTGANTVLSTALPAGYLKPGNVIHVKLWGLNPSESNVRTATLALGSSLTANSVVTGSGLAWHADFWITILAATVQAETAISQVTTTTTITTNVVGAEVIANALNLILTFTNATSGVTPIYGAYAEVIK